jgi:uncharacterized protein YbbC (DUF1343 family)
MEPVIYGAASAIAISVALLAGLPAARRATSVQPMVAMRSEQTVRRRLASTSPGRPCQRMLLPMTTLLPVIVLVLVCATVAAQEPVRSTGPVRPGIEVFLSAVPERIRGKRVGLITNHAGIDRAGTSNIDLIAAHPDVKLVALFAAEHGIRGVAAAGEKVTDGRDPKSGLPIFSLYMAEDRGPTVEMLKEIDALVYDLPEVGGRTWTYVSTMALSMQAAAR